MFFLNNFNNIQFHNNNKEYTEFQGITFTSKKKTYTYASKCFDRNLQEILLLPGFTVSDMLCTCIITDMLP